MTISFVRNQSSPVVSTREEKASKPKRSFQINKTAEFQQDFRMKTKAKIKLMFMNKILHLLFIVYHNMLSFLCYTTDIYSIAHDIQKYTHSLHVHGLINEFNFI